MQGCAAGNAGEDARPCGEQGRAFPPGRARVPPALPERPNRSKSKFMFALTESDVVCLQRKKFLVLVHIRSPLSWYTDLREIDQSQISDSFGEEANLPLYN